MKPVFPVLVALGLASLTALAPTSVLAANVPVVDAVEGDFLFGDGIPIDNFTRNNGLGGVAVLKGRERATGQPISQLGSEYTVNGGLVDDGEGNLVSNWSIDFQFSPFAAGGPMDNYIVNLQIDFDPTSGVDYVDLIDPIFDDDFTADETVDSWLDTGNVLVGTNTEGHAFSDTDVDYVMGGSYRLDFGFFNSVFGKTFDPDVNGRYEVNLIVTDTTFGAVQASAGISVVVVPEPSTLGLLGVFFVALIRRRRAA